VQTVMSLWVAKISGNSLATEVLLAFQGLCSAHLVNTKQATCMLQHVITVQPIPQNYAQKLSITSVISSTI
jgi:hypothetical protein